MREAETWRRVFPCYLTTPREIFFMPDAGAKTGEQEQGSGTPPGGSDAPKGGQDSATIQAAINAVVKREREAADARVRELETRVTDLTTQLGEAKKGTKKEGQQPADVPAEYVESIRKPLLDEVAQLRGNLTTRDNAAKRSEIKRIAADLAVPEAVDDVAEALLTKVRIADAGGFEVVDKDGRAEYGANGPKSLNEAVLELLKAKPFMAKPSVRSGAGFSGSPTTPSSSTDIAALKQAIANHEAKQEFAKAAPLKQQLLDLARKK